MKRFLIFLLLALAGSAGFSQSAQKLTDLISTKEATWADAGWLIAVQNELCEDKASAEEAYNLIKENGYLNHKKEPSKDDKIKLQDFALLCTKANGIKGGLFLRLTKSPRYALRELKAMGVVPNNAAPHQIVSGKQMIDILSGCEYEQQEASK